jgi:hypothetical protein
MLTSLSPVLRLHQHRAPQATEEPRRAHRGPPPHTDEQHRASLLVDAITILRGRRRRRAHDGDGYDCLRDAENGSARVDLAAPHGPPTPSTDHQRRTHDECHESDPEQGRRIC